MARLNAGTPGRRGGVLDHATRAETQDALIALLFTANAGRWILLAGYPVASAASSVEASMSVKVAVSILSINGPVNRPIGPPLGTYR